MIKFDLAKRIVTFLQQNPGKKFNRYEIAYWIYVTYREECLAKKERSKAVKYPINGEKGLIRQIGKEIKVKTLQKISPQIKVTEGRPRLHYFENQDDVNIKKIKQDKISFVVLNEGDKLQEKELYPALCKFAYYKFKIYSKIINNKRSSNANGLGGNKWLHPDLVSLEDLSSEWHPELKQYANHDNHKRAKLWSFEVKKLLNMSNVRESFFQCVSNSSWANFAYLVTEEIKNNCIGELQILCNSYGIGLIYLNSKDIKNSSVHIAAREREVDLNTMNKIALNNKDFDNYIRLINRFYQTLGHINKSDWDYL